MEISGEGEGARDEAEIAIISGTMPALEITKILISRRCRDITGQLDLNKCGRYPVAGGGFGDIYQGALIGGEKIAIKCTRLYLQRDNTSGRKALKHAARELDNWSHFEHENVLKLLGLAHFRDQMAMISPWMDQGTLLQYLEHNPGVDRCQLCIDISEGVAYLHRVDTIHGDIKSANILISGEGVAKLTDFGCTTLKTSTLCFTSTAGGQYLSIRWAAPERLRGGICSKEADVYALGMTLLEAVTGVVPFSDKADIAVQLAVIVDQQTPERPKEFPSFNPDEAEQLWAIVVDSCTHESSDRPGSVTIRDRLQGIRKHSNQPSPDDMIIDLISNAAVNEHGQPQTLSVLPDGIDEGDRGYGEHSDDNDYDERENVDEGGQKSHSDTTSVGRSEAALIGASLNSISEHSILFDCCNGAALVDPQYRVGSMRPALDERSIHLEMLCAEESDSEEARAKEIATAHGNFNVETFSPPTTSSGSSVGHQIPEWPGGILAAPSSANTEWSTSTVPAPPVSAAAETPRPIDYLTGEVIIWAAAGAHQSAFEASCGKSGIVTGALCKALEISRDLTRRDSWVSLSGAIESENAAHERRDLVRDIRPDPNHRNQHAEMWISQGFLFLFIVLLISRFGA